MKKDRSGDVTFNTNVDSYEPFGDELLSRWAEKLGVEDKKKFRFKALLRRTSIQYIDRKREESRLSPAEAIRKLSSLEKSCRRILQLTGGSKSEAEREIYGELTRRLTSEVKTKKAATQFFGVLRERVQRLVDVSAGLQETIDGKGKKKFKKPLSAEQLFTNELVEIFFRYATTYYYDWQPPSLKKRALGGRQLLEFVKECQYDIPRRVRYDGRYDKKKFGPFGRAYSLERLTEGRARERIRRSPEYLERQKNKGLAVIKSMYERFYQRPSQSPCCLSGSYG